MQAMQLCFAGICVGWRKKTRKEAIRVLSGSEGEKTLLGRVTPASFGSKLSVHALSQECRRPELVARKLIFLDMDGPLAPWRNGKQHRWSADDSFEDRAYYKNVDALSRIIDGAGGSEFVKVVVSSNWRTDPQKYPWLIEQMEKRGIDVIGHTDIMCAHPPPRNHSRFARVLEIRRVLEQRVLGTKGPYVVENGQNAFEAAALLANWHITAWIAIDDLDLATSSYHGLQNVHYLSRFMPVPSDPDVGNGWMTPPKNLADGTHAWLKAFATSHFVRVSATDGIAGTKNAEERAIKLLNSL